MITVYTQRWNGPKKTLAELFQDYHIAVGGVGTALIDAAIHGLPVVCLDSRSVCVPIASESTENPKRPEREQWLNNLSYMNWRGDEIASGQAFEYLL